MPDTRHGKAHVDLPAVVRGSAVARRLLSGPAKRVLALHGRRGENHD
jgi:hypothetical protein